MQSQEGVRTGGPLEPFRAGAAEALSARGYSQDRAAQLMRLMAHLSRWLEVRGLGPGDLSPEVVEDFAGGFRSRHSWCRSSRSLAPVLAYLRSVGAVPAACGSRPGLGAGEVLAGDFRSYLRDQRGVSVATVEAYARYATGCIGAWWPDGQVDVAELDAGDVIWLVRTARDRQRPASLREEPATREALERLVASVTRHLEPGKARAIAAEGLEFAESRPLGGTWVLDALSERLGIGPAVRELLTGRRLDPGAERVLFALVANRALAPSSKLAASRWVGEGVLITGLPGTSDDACYRAMDWLLQIREVLEKRVFDRASELLGLGS